MKYVLCLVLYSVGTNTAYAYLDPGTGSIVIQSLIAALAAVSFVITTYWQRVRGYFTKFLRKKSDLEDTDEKRDNE